MAVQQTFPDNGYIVVGYTNSFGKAYQVYLVKTDANGDTLWTRTYGGASDEDGWCVDQTSPDGGYIIAGWTRSFGAGGKDLYLVKTDADGDTLWTRTYGGADDDWAMSVEQTPDGGYIMVGWTKSFGMGANDIYVIRTDASGDTLWTRTYGGPDDEFGHSVQVTADGWYIVAGSTRYDGADSADVYLLRIEGPGAYVRDHDDCPLLAMSEWAPNPFNGSARISFDLPAKAHVDIGIYDVTGRLVAPIGSGAFETGPHTLAWNGTDSRGVAASASIYFCRLKVGEWEVSRKIVLVR
jgi:Tol biopolymer transport system component